MSPPALRLECTLSALLVLKPVDADWVYNCRSFLLQILELHCCHKYVSHFRKNPFISLENSYQHTINLKLCFFIVTAHT